MNIYYLWIKFLIIFLNLRFEIIFYYTKVITFIFRNISDEIIKVNKYLNLEMFFTII